MSCPFISGSSMWKTRLHEETPSTLAASRISMRDSLQAGVEDQHGEGADPGETQEDEGAEGSVRVGQPRRVKPAKTKIFQDDVDDPAYFVKVLPGEDADDPGQAEREAEGNPEPVLRSRVAEAVDKEGHQQAGRHPNRYPDDGPPEQMHERAQEDGVVEQLLEVLEADPYRSGYAVPGGESSFEGSHCRPVAEEADKNECGEEEGPRLERAGYFASSEPGTAGSAYVAG